MLKTFEQWRLEKTFFIAFQIVCPNTRCQQKNMKGPDVEILINIDFQNLDLWMFLGRGGVLRDMSMGRSWLQNQFASLPL